MDVIERIRADRKKTAEELDDISRQKAELETREREKKAQLAELDNALRVADRYATPTEFALAPPVPTADKPTVDDALWRIFSERTEGQKITAVVEEAEKRYGLEINRKTAGNYFWNWGTQGRARREGHVWYPVRPQ
jgi:hypothetical protein